MMTLITAWKESIQPVADGGGANVNLVWKEISASGQSAAPQFCPLIGLDQHSGDNRSAQMPEQSFACVISDVSPLARALRRAGTYGKLHRNASRTMLAKLGWGNSRAVLNAFIISGLTEGRTQHELHTRNGENTVCTEFVSLQHSATCQSTLICIRIHVTSSCTG